ncbi:hypothetical protein GCM10010305_37690 [Streptomyces termitum]|uniref:Transposase n=1 Tax=Streptomyces termitum TaxID=67368 RepID=A0A918WC23_9ACTN|nr:hypothetical protein GCM10010305_37690 [Streptomyces termitum]
MTRESRGAAPVSSKEGRTPAGPVRRELPRPCPADDRAALRGIVYVLRKGVSWAAMYPQSGSVAAV